MSPVCTTNAGRDGMALIASTAICSVPATSGIGGLFEADVAVADLHELNCARRGRDGPAAQQPLGAQRVGNARARPRDVRQKVAAPHDCAALTTIVAFMNGCSSQKYA